MVLDRPHLFHLLFAVYFSAIKGKLFSHSRDIQTLCPDLSMFIHHYVLLSSQNMCLRDVMSIEEQQRLLL